MPTVSVIIPAWNAQERLACCLTALSAQTRLPDQTMVVDNGSTDGTEGFIRTHHPDVNLVSLPENRGWPGAVNAGLRLATGDYIATLDSDAYPTPTWLEALLQAMEKQNVFAFAASRLLLADGSGRIDSAGDGFDLRTGAVMIGHGQPDGPFFNRPREVFSATGAASLFNRKMIDAIGGLDESLFIYSSDIDLGFRARLQGYRCLYVPGAIAYHERSATLGRNSTRQTRFVYRNAITVYLKDMPGPLLRAHWRGSLRLLAGMLHHTPHHGAALWGMGEALWRLPDTLRKRRQVQRTRTVSLERLEAVMTAEGIFLDT